MVRGGTAPHIFYLGSTLRWVVNVTLRLLFSGKEVSVSVHRDKFLTIKPTRCTNFSKFIFGMKLYIFRTVRLSIIRSFSLYTQQWYMSKTSDDSLQAGLG